MSARLIVHHGEKGLPDKPSDMLWEEASDADRVAAIEAWWTKVRPEADSDTYLFLQWMSGPGMGHGDPEAAKKELVDRGLLEPGFGQPSSLTESGREVFFNLYDSVYREYDMSTAAPTPEGMKRHPPDGYFHADFFNEPVSEPCTCTADCPEWCEGQCGCEACTTRLEVIAAPGSVHGEQ